MSTLVRSRALPSFGLALLLVAPTACTKSGETEATDKTEAAPAKTDEAAPKTAESETKTPTPADPGGLSKTVAQGIAAAATGGRLDRGVGLMHVMLPNPSQLLKEIRTNVVPAKQAGMLDEAALRGLAGMALGPRAALANKIALDAPMGCVLVEDETVDVPLACIVGYSGGASAVVTDLGDQGKQADAAGHVGHYRVEDVELYLDDLGEHVVISTGPAIFEKAKGYLETNLVARAGTVADDVDVVMFPKAAMTRYSKQIDGVMSLARMGASAAPPSGNPMLDAFQEYSRTSMDRGLDAYRETDQFDLGLGLDDTGAVLRYAVYPTPGSGTQADAQAVSAGPIDPTLVSSLPAEAWLVNAYTLDWSAAWKLESTAGLRDVMIDVYAAAATRDPADVKAGIETFLTDNASIYAKDMAMAVMHLPGTQGGLVVSRKLQAPGRDSWTKWSEGFAADTVLGAEASKYVTWSFEPGVMEVDGAPVDRWTIEPGPEAKKEIAKKADPVVAEIERRFGGLAISIDRVELDDRALFVVAPGAQEKYVRAAIAAAKGGAGVGADPGFAALLARNPEVSALMAVDVAGALSWAREVLPPEVTRSVPAGLGKDLGDYYFAITYGASGSQRGEMVLSQSMIDQLRGLAG